VPGDRKDEASRDPPHMVSTTRPPLADGVPSLEQPQCRAAMVVSMRVAPSCAMCGAWEAFLATAQQTQPTSLRAAARRPKQAQRPFIPFAFSELF
jgi:hypothetical protein